jgi:2-polyprenyl-3-methyl-5-hydroxy-6-metoxy-1,4-benzoquinol methylase
MEEHGGYLMEDPEEAVRLDVKTDLGEVKKQATLCGICPGARVLDAGCGSGKTTAILHDIAQPGGQAIGIDFAQDRIDFAQKHYENQGIHFHLMDIKNPLEGIGSFDFIWVRFVLEYYLEGSKDIIRNLTSHLKPEGVLCLLDLDYNCMTHYPLPGRMEDILHRLVERMGKKYNFDAFVGRKLYSFLNELGFRDIQMHMMPHHLIYGELRNSDDFNWIKKIQMASRKAHDVFEGYQGGYEGFFSDFNSFFHDPGRFTYTPLLICTGKKPQP